MNPTLVIHHSADLDGLCSREIARKTLKDTADYLGWDYGQSIPDLSRYETVYLIDISLPPAVMAIHAHRLIWIDHHKSAIEAMKGVEIRGYRIDGVAACRLAWQWFNVDDPQRLTSTPGAQLPVKEDYTSIPTKVVEPRAIELLGRYDIWDKRLSEVDPFQLGMQAEKEPRWDAALLLDGPGCPFAPPDGLTALAYVERVTDRGRAIQAYTEVTSAQIITERGFDADFEGLKFRALNIARCNSMTFLAALRPEHDGCLAYFWNGKKWKFSLYHAPGKEQHDLSKIAVKHGGGGHRGACGFELAALPCELGGPSGGAQA